MNIKHLPFSKKTLVVVIAAVLNAGIQPVANAVSTITMDGTTGSVTGAILPTGQTYVLEGGSNLHGTLNNTNLFYSFSQFGIGSGDTALFQCTGCPTVNNVISRVTGNFTSNINGTLQSAVPNANFWLINPNGITLGSNAQITVPASFHLGTAESVLAANGTSVITITSNVSSSLAAATPTQFGFGTATGSIQITDANVVLTAGSNSEIASAGNLNIEGSQVQSNGAGAVTLSAQNQIYVGRYFSGAPNSSLSTNIDLIAGTDAIIDFSTTANPNKVSGNVIATGNIENRENSIIGGNATANVNLTNTGTIQGNAVATTGNLYNGEYFDGDGISIIPGHIGGNASAGGDLINNIDSTITGNAIANNNLQNGGTITGNATATTGSITNGLWYLDPDTFLDLNEGTIQGNATATTGNITNGVYDPDYGYQQGIINGNAVAGGNLTNNINSTISSNASATNIQNYGIISGNADAINDTYNGNTISGNANAGNNIFNSNIIGGNANANNDINNYGNISGNATAINNITNYGNIGNNAVATNGSITNGYNISSIPNEPNNITHTPSSTIKGNATAGTSIANHFNSIIGTSTANQITTGSLFNDGTINGNVQLTSTLTNTANATINGNVVSTHTNTGNVTGDFYANELNNEGVINGNTASNIINQGNITGNAIADNTLFTGNGTTTGIKTGNITNSGNITDSATAITDITNNPSANIGNNATAGNNLTNNAIINANAQAGNTLNNSGSITGSATAGNDLQNTGTINNGAVAGNNLSNSGVINGNAQASNTLNNSGSITNTATGGNINNSGTIANGAAASNDLQNTGTINNSASAGNDLTNNGGTINSTTIKAGRNLTNQNNGVINADTVIAGGSLLNDSGAKIIMRNGSTSVTTGSTLKVSNGASIQSSNVGDFNLFSGGQFIVDNNALISTNNTGDFSIQANGLPLNIQFSELTDKNFYDFIVSDGGKIQKNNSGKMMVTAKNIFLNGVDALVGSNTNLIDFKAVPENATNKSLFSGYFKMKEATMTNIGAFAITGYYLNLDPSGIKSDEAVVLNVSNPQEISFAKVLIGKDTSLFARGMGKDFIDVPTGKLIINGDIPSAPDDNEAVLTRFIPPVNINFKLAELEKRPCNTNKNTLGARNAKGYLPNLSYQVNYSLLSALGNNEIEPVAMDLTRELECSFS